MSDEVADRVQGLVPDAIKEQFMCEVCFGFMENPMRLSCCGWHVCSKHSAQIDAAAGNKCAMAHKTPGHTQHRWGSLVSPNPSFKRLYEAITVQCKHQGCGKVLGVTELFEHEQNQCPKRKVECEHCNKEVVFDGMGDHLADLDACQPDKCPCKWTLSEFSVKFNTKKEMLLMELGTQVNTMLIIVRSFLSRQDGSKGLAESSGIHIGDNLIGVNNVYLQESTLSDFVTIIKETEWPMTLHFRRQSSIKRHMKKCIHYQFTCGDCGELAQCWRWHKAVCSKQGGTKRPIEIDDNTPKRKKTKRASASSSSFQWGGGASSSSSK